MSTRDWHSAVSWLRETTWREYMRADLDGNQEVADGLRIMSGLCTLACGGDRAAIGDGVDTTEVVR